MDQLNPHELLLAQVAESLGRRAQVFGELKGDFFEPLVLGVSEQLSAYQQCVNNPRLKVGRFNIRHGATRAYVIAELKDRGRPLRLREAMRRWEIGDTTSYCDSLIDAVNSRRGAFVDKHLHSLILPLLEGVANQLIEYYARRPHAQPQVGVIRLMEEPDATFLVAEVDDRAPNMSAKESPSRYLVQ